MNFRSAKIVCTLGPASNSSEMIVRLMRSGMDVARLNFSHGTHEDHARTIKRVREASARLSKPIGILADLQGPKIRTGTLKDKQPVQLVTGQRFTISIRSIDGTSEGVSTTYERMARDVARGDRILLGDGLIELQVLSTTSTTVLCKVINGGLLGEHKGINLPGVKLRIPAVTPKDHEDLVFALEQGANFVAVSFVRSAKDVLQAKKAISREKQDVPVIAKLEKPEAIEHLDEILHVSDGVMVARGDLGVEMSPEKVPVVQKQIISRACEARRPVITATQMLESMTLNPRPTRAEASDVANAVFDGSDALMLSAETASGAYPLEAVQMMDRIIREAEANNSHVLRPSPAQFNIAETASEPDLPRFGRIAHESDCRIYRDRFPRRAWFPNTGRAARSSRSRRFRKRAAACRSIGASFREPLPRCRTLRNWFRPRKSGCWKNISSSPGMLSGSWRGLRFFVGGNDEPLHEVST